jgi:hypothetical protein
MKKAGYWITGLGLVALASVAIVVSQAEAAENADLKKIADAVKKGDMDGAKKLAAKYAAKNKDVGELMEAYKKKKNSGIMAIGPAGKGIEDTIRELKRDVPTKANLDKFAADFEELGYNVIAVALVTKELAPAKGNGKSTPKEWVKWSEDLVEAGQKLASAGKAKGAAELKTHANKVDTICSACHIPWK